MQNWLFDIRSRSFVLLVLLFLVITALVYSDITKPFDDAIVFAFSQAVGNPTIDIIMQSITESGDVFNMLAFGIVILLIPKNP